MSQIRVSVTVIHGDDVLAVPEDAVFIGGLSIYSDECVLIGLDRLDAEHPLQGLLGPGDAFEQDGRRLLLVGAHDPYRVSGGVAVHTITLAELVKRSREAAQVISYHAEQARLRAEAVAKQQSFTERLRAAQARSLVGDETAAKIREVRRELGQVEIRLADQSLRLTKWREAQQRVESIIARLSPIVAPVTATNPELRTADFGSTPYIAEAYHQLQQAKNDRHECAKQIEQAVASVEGHTRARDSLTARLDDLLKETDQPGFLAKLKAAVLREKKVKVRLTCAQAVGGEHPHARDVGQVVEMPEREAARMVERGQAVGVA